LEKIVHGNKKVVLDLKGIVHLSSAGGRAIVKMLHNEQKSGGNIKLACMPEVVVEVLETVGMMELVQSYKNVEDAIASF
jgi:anti-sigma B factor antagonist